MIGWTMHPFKTWPESIPDVYCRMCCHTEKQHADKDYDFNGEGYVECKRPCSLCECEGFWQ